MNEEQKDEFRQIVRELLPELLRDESIRKWVWLATNKTPPMQDFSPLAVFRISDKLFEIAAIETAKYVSENMVSAKILNSKEEQLKFSVSLAEKQGLFLEFGVADGNSVNIIAESIADRLVYGFDSFQGLPENWEFVPAGTFSTEGILPKVRDNVQLQDGLFEATLLEFLKTHKEPVSFLHIDSDLYSSARTVLFTLQEQIIQGTIIEFDEYFNYPNWKQHEYKAFQEFVHEFNVKYEYVAFNDNAFSVTVRIL
jgi:hypothetical protein